MERRLHKFMAWDTNERRMLSSDEFMAIPLFASIDITLNYITDLIVLEWTGLQDKHGKDIFEGHILKKGNRVHEVIFKDGAFVILLTHTQDGRPFHLDLRHDITDMEIIGDIFQNPELLESNVV